ncbi:unnamed protein product [Phytophthora fragariaefolia]|uniref:Unnamed protein product n=1 Tax=Phytophthora fragariaefolia TaxID=1490495 RepID=A0A9W6YLS2_9STRA|nr:unnamed protein product [Phytophthora fragariaefolia]
MITRGASDPAIAPSSPSSRAAVAPSDSEASAAPTAAAVVVDVTGGVESWTTTSARRTPEPTPLTPSKRPPAKTVIAAAVPEKGKGTKRLTRRPSAGSAAAKKGSTGGGHDSDSSLEDKPALPPVKKPRKTPTAAKAPAAMGTSAKAPSETVPAQAKTVTSGTNQPPYGGDTPAGNAAVPAGLLTLRSGTAIQPVPAIQPAQISPPPDGAPSPHQPDQVALVDPTEEASGDVPTGPAGVLPPVSFVPTRQPTGSKTMEHGSPALSASPRHVVSMSTAAKWHANARARSDLLRQIGRATLAQAMSKRGIELPPDDYPVCRDGDAGPEFLLNKPLQHALSELARRTGASLPAFVELVRGQTPRDYRPNKNLVPEVLEKLCKDYKHLDALQKIVQEGVEVRLKQPPPLQRQRPPNHGSARDRLNVLRKNIRKEQDAGRCLVLDKDLLEQWPEIIISPFGVVDKGHEDAVSSGRTIHDLSFPEGSSINGLTDQDSITKPDYIHCDAVATEILRLKRAHRESKVCVMGGDVASAFRNIGIHTNSVYRIAGHIEEDDAIVIELAAPFG